MASGPHICLAGALWEDSDLDVAQLQGVRAARPADDRLQ